MQNSEQDNLDFSSKAASLLELDNLDELSHLLSDLHAVELSDLLNNLDTELQPKILNLVTGLDQLSELITHANKPLRKLIVNSIDDTRLVAVARRMEVDDAADFISELTRRRQVKILRRLSPKKAKDLKSLLAYEKETAGRIMTTYFFHFDKNDNAKKTLQFIRKALSDGDSETDLHYCYVLDQDKKIEGVFSLRELLSQDEKTLLSDFMQTEVISVEDQEDQELVAKLIADYDLTAVPVVSAKTNTGPNTVPNSMIGIITIDDVIDIIEDEHTEDILKLVGTEDTDTVGATFSVAMKSRMPWLFASCLGGCGAAVLLGAFSSTLEQLIALAFFMPVVFGMGGNVGSQASTITVRGLATGDLNSNRSSDRIKKEAGVGILLGICFAIITFLASYLLFGELKLSIIVSSSTLLTIFCSSTLGAVLPVIFDRLGFDPAVSSGPLVTTGSDILSGLIYFSIANALL